MLQFDLQFYEELTVARVKTVKFISGAFFFGRQVSLFFSKNEQTEEKKSALFTVLAVVNPFKNCRSFKFTDPLALYLFCERQ